MNWIRFEGSPCRTVPAPLASQPLAGAPLVVCRREHSPPPCGGQGARDEDLGRKPVGKKCNRKGNLCKKAHGTADSSMAAGLSCGTGSVTTSSRPCGSPCFPLHGSPARPCGPPRQRAPDSARSC